MLLGCDDQPKQKVADFSLELFDGTIFAMSGHSGPMVVNFFASWCIPCKIEARELEIAYRQYNDKNVIFLGIAIQDTEEKAIGFVKEHGITFSTGLDKENKLRKSFGVYGIPTTFFIDKEGFIQYTHAGAVMKGLIIDELDKML